MPITTSCRRIPTEYENDPGKIEAENNMLDSWFYKQSHGANLPKEVGTMGQI